MGEVRKLPPDPEGMNEERAEWAREAVHRFREVCGGSSNDDGSPEMGEAIGDLLCNLMHLCDREGFDPAAMMERAKRCYAEETMGEEETEEDEAA